MTDLPAAMVARVDALLAGASCNRVALSARDLIRAVLEDCQVREEEGLRLTWVATGVGAPLDDHFDGNQLGWARNAVAYHLEQIANEPDWKVQPTLIRRLHITTAPEEKTDE